MHSQSATVSPSQSPRVPRIILPMPVQGEVCRLLTERLALTALTCLPDPAETGASMAVASMLHFGTVAAWLRKRGAGPAMCALLTVCVQASFQAHAFWQCRQGSQTLPEP